MWSKVLAWTLFVQPPERATPHFWELNINQLMWSSTLIDDMGLKILPAKSGEILLEIIMRRYENRSTMMTSNRPIEEWGKLLSDVPAAGAILDRLLHHAEIIPINGRSYRLQPTAKQPPGKK
jgi:DNA replication protein DnaC